MKYLILILFFLTGCGHSITLNPKGCYSNGLLKSLDKNIYTVEKTIVAIAEPSEEYLKDILELNNIDCRKVKNINYAFKTSFTDSLVSLIPLVERKTIIINYSID